EIAELHNAGHRLLIPEQVERELLVGNVATAKSVDDIKMPSPSRGMVLWLRGKYNIRVDLLDARARAHRDAILSKARQNLSETDAVILSEVVAGARARSVQNPILLGRDKGLVATAPKFGVAVRKPKVYIPSTPAAAASPPLGTPLPKLPLKIKLVGAGLAIMGLGMLSSYLGQKGYDSQNREKLEAGLKRLEPEVDRYVQARKRRILDQLSSSGQ